MNKNTVWNVTVHIAESNKPYFQGYLIAAKDFFDLVNYIKHDIIEQTSEPIEIEEVSKTEDVYSGLGIIEKSGRSYY